MSELILASLLIMSASFAGVFTLWKKAGTAMERSLDLLVSFSAGVFLVVAYELGHEAVEHSETFNSGFLWIAAGAMGLFLFFKLIPTFHHHHHDDHEEAPHSHIDTRRILFGDALHNIGDGILLASAFGLGRELGVVTAVSVFVHELVQETSEFFVLKQAGYSTGRALLVNFLVSTTILIGAVGSYLLVDTFETIEGPLLGIAAGSFLVVVFHDLIPHSAQSVKNGKHTLRHIGWFLLGLGVMTAADMLLGH